jgi:hypothetical protein
LRPRTSISEGGLETAGWSIVAPLFGCEPTELIGKSTFPVVHPGDLGDPMRRWRS